MRKLPFLAHAAEWRFEWVVAMGFEKTQAEVALTAADGDSNWRPKVLDMPLNAALCAKDTPKNLWDQDMVTWLDMLPLD